MDAHTQPLFLSPALPSDLLNFIIHRCTYPTTLIICSDRAQFLSALSQDVKHQQQQPSPHQVHEPQPKPLEPQDSIVGQQKATTDPDNHYGPTSRSHQPQTATQPNKLHPLLTSPLHTIAITRHIRTVFVPTVSHLRAFLSIFSVHTTTTTTTTPKVPPPLPPGNTSSNTNTNTKTSTIVPLLLVFNFLSLHRHTSEWSVQGLSSTAAALVEAGRREGVRVVVVEQQQLQPDCEGQGGKKGEGEETAGVAGGWVGEEEGRGEGEGEEQEGGERKEKGRGQRGMQALLAERVPVLSGSARRTTGLDLHQHGGEGSGWAGRTVDVERVLGRWFRFRAGELESAGKGGNTGG